MGHTYQFSGYVKKKSQIPQSHSGVGYIGRSAFDGKSIAVYKRKKR